MSVAKVMPTRDQARPAIVDLDEILSVKTTVKVNGKTYALSPITVRNAPEIERAKIEVMAVKDAKSFDDVCEIYYAFISLLCPEMTLQDLKDLSLVQLTKLFHVFVSHIRAEMNGQTLYEQNQAEEEEKKKTRLTTNL